MQSTSLSPSKRLNQSARTKKRTAEKVVRDGLSSPSGKIAFSGRYRNSIGGHETIYEEEVGQKNQFESIQAENSQLNFEVGEKEVELDRMKTTLFALNSKLQQWEDMQANCQSSAESLALSESRRSELQALISSSGLKIQDDLKMHSTQKVELSQSVSELHSQMEQKESVRIATEKRHQEEIEGLKGQFYQTNLEHQSSIQSLTTGHYSKISELNGQFDNLKSSHNSELTQRNALLQATIDEHRSGQERLQNGYEIQLHEVKNDHTNVLSDLKGQHAANEEQFNMTRVSLQNSHQGQLTSLKDEQNSQNSQYFENLRVMTDGHLNDFQGHSDQHDQHLRNHGEKFISFKNQTALREKEILEIHANEKLKHKIAMTMKDSLHKKQIQDLRNQQLEELKKHRADRELREQNNRDYLNTTLASHSEQLKNLQGSHSAQLSSIQIEHSEELSTLRLTAEQKQALHNGYTQRTLKEHLDLREQTYLDHSSQILLLNEQMETMKKTHKGEHDLKDQKHNQLFSDLKNGHLDELRRHREDREQREANNRAYLNQTLDNHTLQLKSLQDGHSDQLSSIQNEHKEEKEGLRLNLEEKEASHIVTTGEIHDEHNLGKEELHSANQEMLAYHASEVTSLKELHASSHSEVLLSHHNLISEMKDQHSGKLSQVSAEHQLALNGFNQTLSEKEQYHLNLVESMQKSHSSELQRKLQERIALETKHTIQVNLLVAQHKRDKDSTNITNVSDMRSYDQKLIDKHNDYAENAKMSAQERADYEALVNGNMLDIHSQHNQKVESLISQNEAARAQRELEHQGQIGNHIGNNLAIQAQLNQHIYDLSHARNTQEHLKSQLLANEILLFQKSDVESQHREALLRESSNNESRGKLQGEVDSCTEYILQLEEKVYRSHKTSLELLRQLKDAEIEIQALKDRILDLQTKIAVYIPVKQDTIDKKLAEYINNFPERQKLKILFMRESEGVYQFGTKKVSVRVDMDRINIRVGGGYLSIDEFLDQYTPVELQKLERKDPMRKFNERIAIQKTLVNRAVRETSPTDGKDRSRERDNSPQMTSSATMFRSQTAAQGVSIKNVLKYSM